LNEITVTDDPQTNDDLGSLPASLLTSIAGPLVRRPILMLSRGGYTGMTLSARTCTEMRLDHRLRLPDGRSNNRAIFVVA
jgi:hypothetical protein